MCVKIRKIPLGLLQAPSSFRTVWTSEVASCCPHCQALCGCHISIHFTIFPIPLDLLVWYGENSMHGERFSNGPLRDAVSTA